jgi:hypothetical protein
MKPLPSFLILATVLRGLAVPARAADAPTPMPVVTNDSAKWIPIFGENIWAQYHPDWQGWFPGGHSNRFHQMYVQNVWDHHPVTKDWEVFNKHWVFDGEWFAVEWFYRAKFMDDGFRQWESTLGIGHLKDGKLISWTEYFDDEVGYLQHLRLMPPYDDTEPVYPWPAKAILKLPYRP